MRGVRQKRHFKVPLVSQRLGLRGEVDPVIEADADGRREAIPVDYKLSTKVGQHSASSSQRTL